MTSIGIDVDQIFVENTKLKLQQNLPVITGPKGNFQSIDIHATTDNKRDTTTQNQLTGYDVEIGSTATNATGTITLDTVLAGDFVTVNGLVYTAVAGVKSNNTEFSIDGSDTVDAADLADSIQNDTREGTIGDVFANSAAAVVTCFSSLIGDAGDIVTLTSGSGTMVVSGAGTFTGGTSTNAAAAIKARELVTDGSLTAQFIPNFFEDVSLIEQFFFAIPRSTIHGTVEYVLFHTSDSISTVDLDLYYGTVEAPEGEPPQLPFFFSGTFQDVKFVPRNQKGAASEGLTRIYDYFAFAT